MSCEEKINAEFFREENLVKEDLQSEINRRKLETKQNTKDFGEHTTMAMAEDYYRMDELANKLAVSTSGGKKKLMNQV